MEKLNIQGNNPLSKSETTEFLEKAAKESKGFLRKELKVKISGNKTVLGTYLNGNIIIDDVVEPSGTAPAVNQTEEEKRLTQLLAEGTVTRKNVWYFYNGEKYRGKKAILQALANER